MFTIGSATPILFPQYWRDYPMENSVNYIQKFYSGDTIIVQVVSDTDAPLAYLKSLTNPSVKTFVEFTSDTIGDYNLFTLNMSGLEDDVYQLVIGGYRSAPFEVCSSDEILSRTKLIKYTNHGNSMFFGNVFNDGEIVFEFRVECGFKSNGVQPKLDCEFFRDQNQNIKFMYAQPYLVETLTFGDARGLPAMYADFINRLFCFDTIDVGGVKVKRSEGSVPSLNKLMDYGQQYVITLDVEVVNDKMYEDNTDNVIRAIADESGSFVTDESGNLLFTEI